ncbi:MAG: isocitrate/isopropylmalate dehydrogenase family protein [Thermoplasmata archaeon]|jgi:isopropylmalate/isohomocitrate dehydrogenase-like protein|nr:isocitrate/isopropylmalate dehydrogenase family protein [Thermoplasmata archaeon]
MKTICVLPGDGIGPEVVGCAVEVLAATTSDLRLVPCEIGAAAAAKYGDPLPQETLESMRKSDSCLFGAVTSSGDRHQRSAVLTFRKELDLYANIRPVRTMVHVHGRSPIDVLIIRENSEGLYTQQEVCEDGGVTTRRRVTSAGSKRICSAAVDIARSNGRKRICCVHKANVLRESDGLFLRTFRETMADAPDLGSTDQLVDSAGMKLVTDPASFDTIVTLNLYGDILSDVAAGVAGGLGFAPSGNIGPEHSVFEPAHGSAPDIAGLGVANPTAAILSAAMMLRHIGLEKESVRIEHAVSSAYRAGNLTKDVGGPLESKEFTDAVMGFL